MDVSPHNHGVLQIEPTDHCNLSCSMCAPHHDGWAQIHGVPKGFMDLALYRSIIDGLAQERVRFDHLIFQWLGDPSLHPGLEDMVAHAQDRLHDLVGYLRIDTNAIVLTPERMDRLVAIHARRPELPLLVVFTIDAVTSETYLRVKGQDALERVRRHVRRFIMQRARLPEGTQLNVQLQFVLQDGNAHECGDFVRYWSSVLECHGNGRGYSEIMVKRLSVGAGGEGQLAADRLYERTVREAGIRDEDRGHVHVRVWEERPWESTATPGARQPCPGLWMTPVIRHDGALMMCCADLPGELALGSLKEASFLELWEGKEAIEKRLAHVRGAFSEVGPCLECGGINWYRTPPEFVEGWLDRVGHSELLPDYLARQ